MSDWTVAHDFFYQFGGAERVTATIANLAFPQSEVVAIAGEPHILEALDLARADLIGGSSYKHSNYRVRSLVSPLSLPIRRPIEGNLIASSYAFAHHLRATGRRIVYCHSPLRQIWTGQSMYAAADGGARRRLRAILPPMRRLDVRAARRADAYIATNNAVAGRIREFYGIEPRAIIPPPVDDSFFLASPERSDEFLWAGRVVEPYKKLGLLIEAFRNLPYKLRVAGDGRDLPRLRAAAPKNVEFLGSLSTVDLAQQYSIARALIFPSEDDFGMVPVEAMASGTPVIAWAGGGALETVTAETGVFFTEQTAQAVEKAVRDFDRSTWDRDLIVRHASKFSTGSFCQKIREVSMNLGRS